MELYFNVINVKEKLEDNEYTESVLLLRDYRLSHFGLTKFSKLKEILDYLYISEKSEVELIIKDYDLLVYPMSIIINVSQESQINKVYISNDSIRVYKDINLIHKIINDNLFKFNELRLNDLVRYIEIYRSNNWDELFKFHYEIPIDRSMFNWNPFLYKSNPARFLVYLCKDILLMHSEIRNNGRNFNETFVIHMYSITDINDDLDGIRFLIITNIIYKINNLINK